MVNRLDKKNIILLLSGLSLYVIGFLWLSMIGKISMLMGGVLLGIFFIKIGTSLNNKMMILGKIIKGFGVAFLILVIIVMSIIIIGDIASWRSI